MDMDGAFNVVMNKKSKYKNQDYDSIKRSCIQKGENFTDPEFSPNSKSIFFSRSDDDIKWIRPGELCRYPKLIEAFSAFDLHEGELGNTWFVTAIGTLILYRDIVEKVIPNLKKQEWKGALDKSDYTGVFQFRFWRFGETITIVVDDQLPTKNNKLLFCHSRTREVFWCSLLEKAYAKLFGDYESLTDGDAIDALVDFTGGFGEKINLLHPNIDLKDESIRGSMFGKLKEAMENKSLIICYILVKPGDKRGKELPQGFVLGHGYTVTDVKQLKIERGKRTSNLSMIKMANPWGTMEWNGPWSEKSSEMQKMDPLLKPELEFSKDKGEFWMAFEDFVNYFTNVDICHLLQPSNENILHSEWTLTGRSGGCDFESPLFLSNPQFLFDIKEEEDTLRVSLEQHDIRLKKSHTGRTLNTIGYAIMKVEENRIYRLHIPVKVCETSEMVKSRSVFGTCTLPKGRYVIIPCTKDPKEHGHFLLRLYNNSKGSVRELTQDGPTTTCPCFSMPVMVTTLTVLKIEKITKPIESKDKDIQ
ncbi:calpain-5-like isoform X2 [Mytilus californianus]|uniref:calpain-5-like isoform X2 n=1 Tax=Mytilus californianus TaxID=6549 RepID=UPI0022480258|nr:calpain-5-like isoform X2 [Mytilus californianus]